MLLNRKIDGTVAVSAASVRASRMQFLCKHRTRPVPAEKLAKTAEDALEQSLEYRPIIDCGTDDFKLAEGRRRRPARARKFEAVVTYDGRLAAAAEANGVAVLAPS